MTAQQIERYNEEAKQRGSTRTLLVAGPDAPPQNAVRHVAIAVSREEAMKASLFSGTLEMRALEFACIQALKAMDEDFGKAVQYFPGSIMIFQDRDAAQGEPIFMFNFEYEPRP